MLLNMERSAKLLDVELPLTELSDIELKPESPSKDEESTAFLSKPLEEKPIGLGRHFRDGDLVEEAGTGLTPRIDFRMELDSSKEDAAEESLGLSGVDVDNGVVVLMAVKLLWWWS